MYWTKHPVKVVLVLQSEPRSGGANHYELALHDMMRDVCSELKIELIVFTKESMGLSECHKIPNSVFDNLKLLLNGFMSIKGQTVPASIFRTRFSKLVSSLGADSVYFASPNKLSIDKSLPNVFSTVWDLGHRDLPGMPELSSWRKWLIRELYFRFSISNSRRVITDSIATANRLQDLYGVPHDSLVNIGLLPKNLIASREAAIVTGEYFLYPAQKWRHKNHATIIKALALLNLKRPGVKLVLTGADKGEGARIKNLVKSLKLDGQVLDMGFVDEETLLNLETHSKAILMPTLLGPTNIPPLDALSLGVPTLISDVHKFEVHQQSKMTLVEALNPQAWAVQMLVSIEGPRPEKVIHSSGPARQALRTALKDCLLSPDVAD